MVEPGIVVPATEEPATMAAPEITQVADKHAFANRPAASEVGPLHILDVAIALRWPYAVCIDSFLKDAPWLPMSLRTRRFRP